MFTKIKTSAVLITVSAVLLSGLETNIVFADTANSTDSTSTVTDTSTQNINNPTAQTTTQTDYTNIDIAAVKAAMFNELNRLRSQNGLSPLTSVDVLNNYAQARTDSFINIGGVDNHSHWNTAEMYPYNLTAGENIAQMPFSMIGTTDPNIIAEKITDEFYSEKYDSTPNYGHRKNMLNPYINYVGIGFTVSDSGMVYFSQEMGNDTASRDKYSPNDIQTYYLTKYNDYANPSQYDIANINRKNADYTNRANYNTADIRGGVTTKDYVTPVYDRYGNKRNDLELSPNSDWFSDIIANINGNYYYHVSNNGFVSANDALPWATFLYGSSVVTTTDAIVYDNNGNNTGKTVAANTKFSFTRRAVNPQTGKKMYHIDTNAWIQENQLYLK
ncbi:MAG TPA: hypothetical protein DEQ50_10570 [Lactobacillus sp.]|nr:hypothetical protein [Lactobacillus sp.]